MATKTAPAAASPREADPQVAHEVTVADYHDYREAQAAVDHLADQGFPVQDVSIVGHGLTSVEQITGRMTKGRAALAGAGTGAWFGVLLGLLLGIFNPGLVWLSVILTSVLMGAAWGAVIGFVAKWAQGGRRDFTSLRGMAAERYDVVVRRESADEAARLLAARAR